MAYTIQYGGQTYNVDANTIVNALEGKSEEEVKSILRDLTPEDRSKVVEAWNTVKGTNVTTQEVDNWIGVSSPSVSSTPTSSSSVSSTSSDLGSTTTITTSSYQAPTVNISDIEKLYGSDLEKYYDVPAHKFLSDNLQYYNTILPELSKKYNIPVNDLITKGREISNWWHSLSDEEKIKTAQRVGVSPYQVDFDVFTLETSLGLKSPGLFKSNLPNTVPASKDLTYYARKYNIDENYLKNNWYDIFNYWKNMDEKGKQQLAQKLGRSVEEINTDIYMINDIINSKFNIAQQNKNQQARQKINTLQNITIGISNQPIQQVPTIEPPRLEVGFDYKNLQKDLFENMRAQIMDEYEKQLDKINASASKMGLFRSGLNLKMQEELAKDTERALAQAWGDAAIKAAKLQAEMAMKKGDWELAARMQNVANQLTQEKITNEMQLGLLNAQLQKYGIDTQADINRAKLALEKYGIDIDVNTRYDLAAIDYLKAMNLARADVMTRVTTSYLQYNMDAYKQLLQNKNYKEANTFWANNLLPLLTTMLPTIIQFTGENPDAEQLQLAYQKIYGIRLDPETINKLIDDVNKLTEKVKLLGNKTEETYIGE